MPPNVCMVSWAASNMMAISWFCIFVHWLHCCSDWLVDRLTFQICTNVNNEEWEYLKHYLFDPSELLAKTIHNWMSRIVITKWYNDINMSIIKSKWELSKNIVWRWKYDKTVAFDVAEFNIIQVAVLLIDATCFNCCLNVKMGEQ